MSIRIAALKPIVEGISERDLGRFLRSTVTATAPQPEPERLGDVLRRAYAEERMRREPTLTPAIREAVTAVLTRAAPMGAAIIPIDSLLTQPGGAVSLEGLVAQMAAWLRSEGLKVSIVRSGGPGAFRVSSIAVSWTPEPESARFDTVA